LYHCVAPVIQNQGETPVTRDHVAGAMRCTSDNASGCGSVTAHLDRSTVTHDRSPVGIHPDEIAGEDVIVAANEHQGIVRISGEAESADRGTGTIARQSTSGRRTKLDDAIAGRVPDNLD
jgi:hypothetical protein